MMSFNLLKQKLNLSREVIVSPRLMLNTYASDSQTKKEGKVMSEKKITETQEEQERRESVVDRRLGLDRRRGPGKRRTDDRKAAEEGHMSDEQFVFLMAIDEYRRKNSRPFPTWTEVLAVIKALGYRRVAEPQSLEQLETDPNQPQLIK